MPELLSEARERRQECKVHFAPFDVPHPLKETVMDITTLLLIVIVVILLGGGYYGRNRWF